MKLASLLAQYLYTNKRLDLPGIGSFLLDPSTTVEAESTKHRQAIPDGISFQNNQAAQDATELIGYICSKTGKMKALAASDLDSHLQLAQQFLNIGKPFTFEGIGSLVKIKTGFEFTPANIVVDKIKETPEKEVHGVAKKDTVEAKYQAYLSTPAAKNQWKKPVLVLLIFCGIGLAIWGGYTISTNNAEKEESALSNTETLPADTSQLKKPDSTIKATPPPTDYKYVLEVAQAKRAFKRYNQLVSNQWKIEMETKDSVQYKLFLRLPMSRDTTHIVDSLTVLTGRKVYVENQN